MRLYSEDFKIKVVNELKSTGNLSFVARGYNVPISTLRGWKAKYLEKDKNNAIVVSDIMEAQNLNSNGALESLKKQLERQNIEIELLKEMLGRYQK